MSTHQKADDAQTVAAGADDPLLASVITSDDTTLTPIPVSALPGWRLLDVLWRGPAHPQRWLVAVAADRVLVLTGGSEPWDQLTEGAKVTTAAAAIEVATLRATAVHPPGARPVVLRQVDDIRWLPQPGSEQRSDVARARADLADRISPPGAIGEGPWTVTLWVRVGDTVERHEVQVDHDGTTTATVAVAARSLPVPVSR